MDFVSEHISEKCFKKSDIADDSEMQYYLDELRAMPAFWILLGPLAVGFFFNKLDNAQNFSY